MSFLASKGFWAEKLGVGDFYYELAVQIVEVCMSTNHINGGVMTIEELRNRLLRSRARTRRDAITMYEFFLGFLVNGESGNQKIWI